MIKGQFPGMKIPGIYFRFMQAMLNTRKVCLPEMGTIHYHRLPVSNGGG
jgi:hypothetical protein